MLKFRNMVEWGIGKKTSLKYKIIKNAIKSFLLYLTILLIIMLIFEIFLYGNRIYLHLRDFLQIIIPAIIIAGITFTFSMFCISRTLRINLFTRLESLQDEMKDIKSNGNHSKRLSVKGFDELDELIYFTNTVMDNFEEKINFEQKFSLRDTLTLCYNRRALENSFENFMSRSKRGEKINIGCLYFDLDDFKKINDTYGHNYGDLVLKNIAQIVKKNLRSQDNLYRIGGEEFVILFFNLPKKKAKILTQRIQTNITYKLKKEIPDIEEKISISGGYVESKKLELSKSKALEKMLDRADKLLYKAKHSGKDKVLFER